MTETCGKPQQDDRYSKQPCSSASLNPLRSLSRFRVPEMDASSPAFSVDKFVDQYRRFRVVHLKQVPLDQDQTRSLSWKDIGGVFEILHKSDQDSWCAETTDTSSLTPEYFLVSTTMTSQSYCSFLVQNDRESFANIVAKLPFSRLPWVDWEHGQSLWVFFGRNLGHSDTMQGRPEHTDAVSQDGTWHFQMSGTKEWLIRPTATLLNSSEIEWPWASDVRASIVCNAGDVLVIE